MIHRFATLPEAIAFKNESKLKGHYAEILHFHTGHIWCETTTLGFPVLVSEESCDQPPEEEMKVYWLPRWLNTVLTYLFVISMALMALLIVFVLSYNFLLWSSLFPAAAGRFTITALIVIPVFTYGMNLMYRKIRDVQDLHKLSYFYYLFYLPIMIFLIFSWNGVLVIPLLIWIFIYESITQYRTS